MIDIDAHHREIQANIENWRRKPLLRKVYRGFHEEIANHLTKCSSGSIVELGSGVADITEIIPHCIRTDLFPNPWIDHVENAYELSFKDRSVSDLILFDVFHHLRYPGAALNEFRRVLAPRGRVIIFEPDISLLGWVVYGLLHKEPIAFRDPIQWHAPAKWNPADIDYYAAQGNAMRIFLRQEIDVNAFGWDTIIVKQLCSTAYAASGGYSKPQLYPTRALPIMQKLDQALDCAPRVFSTRLVVVLEGIDNTESSTGNDA